MLLQLELNISRCHGTNERIKSVLLHLVYKRHETSKALGNRLILSTVETGLTITISTETMMVNGIDRRLTEILQLQ